MGSGAWSNDATNSITIPTGATTGPRIVIGSALPSPLNLTYRAALIEYMNNTDYEFEAVGTVAGVGRWAKGTFDTVNGLLINEQIDLASATSINIGGNATSMEWFYLSGTVNVSNAHTSQFTVGLAPSEKIVTADSSVHATNGAFSVGSTASAAYADAPGSPQVQFHKEYANTGVLVTVHATAFNAGALSQVRWGVSINGVDYDVCQLPYSTLGNQWQASGVLSIQHNQVPAGTWPVVLRWRNVGGVGTIQTSGTDWRSLWVHEIGD